MQQLQRRWQAAGHGIHHRRRVAHFESPHISLLQYMYLWPDHFRSGHVSMCKKNPNDIERRIVVGDWLRTTTNFALHLYMYIGTFNTVHSYRHSWVLAVGQPKDGRVLCGSNSEWGSGYYPAERIKYISPQRDARLERHYSEMTTNPNCIRSFSHLLCSCSPASSVLK